jgi:hypothetical protein
MFTKSKIECFFLIASPLIYPWSRKGSLFLLCHSQISQTTACLMVRSWYLWKAIEWLGSHPLGLRLFGAMVWKLSIIESFFQWKLNKLQTENCIGILRCSWCCWKVISKSDLIEFISQFSKLRCLGGYWFFNRFCYWKFKQIAKIGFGRKHQLSPECVHILEFRNFQFWKSEK